MFKRIPLPDGLFATVDEDDYPFLSRLRWELRGEAEGYRYPVAVIGHYKIAMHRMIAQPQGRDEVDHINRDPLDNRRSNLRVCNHSENLANRKMPRKRRLFRGVAPHRTGFRARLAKANTQYQGPTRRDPQEAARDYDRLAVEHYGEFAVLNFPPAA